MNNVVLLTLSGGVLDASIGITRPGWARHRLASTRSPDDDFWALIYAHGVLNNGVRFFDNARYHHRSAWLAWLARNGLEEPTAL